MGARGLLLAAPAFILGLIGLVAVQRQPKRRGLAHGIVAVLLGLLGSYNYVMLFLMLRAAPAPSPTPGVFPYW